MSSEFFHELYCRPMLTAQECASTVLYSPICQLTNDRNGMRKVTIFTLYQFIYVF